MADTQEKAPARRGRPAKRVYINVLVRESTRAAMNRIKARDGVPSQGELIDQLVEAHEAGRRGRA